MLVEDYARQHVHDRSLLQGTPSAELLSVKTIMMDTRVMTNFGIGVYRVAQTRALLWSLRRKAVTAASTMAAVLRKRLISPMRTGSITDDVPHKSTPRCDVKP